MRLTSPRMRVIAFEISGQGVGGGVGENKLEGEGASASAKQCFGMGAGVWLNVWVAKAGRPVAVRFRTAGPRPFGIVRCQGLSIASL